jgi:hexosaminidase
MLRFPLGLKFATLAMLALFAGNASAAVNIVPKPVTMTTGTGTLTFAATDVVTLYGDGSSKDSTLPWIVKLFTNAHIAVTLVSNAADAKVAVTMAANSTLGTEGYTLNITTSQVAISAPTLTGQFYAVQTLRQLFPAGVEDSSSTAAVSLPVLSITDYPKFAHRGIMVDPVRHFCPIDYLYQTVDRLALYKVNRIHLLISNDQGYRLESKVFPNLNTVGSQTCCNGTNPPIHPPAGTIWYYLQADMKALCAYAAKRKIEIYPEIDMPGHCTAICASYPYMGTPNNAVQTTEDVGLSIMNSTGTYADSVMKFIGKLWREVYPCFPYAKRVCMGGDECGTNVISAADLKLIAMKIQDTCKAVGIPMVVSWDEIAKDLALEAGNWSQDWHPNQTGGQIKSECTYLYLDHANESGDNGAINWCTPQYKPLSQAYASTMTASYQGLEATLFSERLSSYPANWDTRMWPRMTAVAEVGWNQGMYSDFATRIGPQGTRLSAMGIGYWKNSGVTWGTGTQNSIMTSVYNKFDPTLAGVTGVTLPLSYSSNRTPRFFTSDAYKIYDLSGRVIATINKSQEIARAIKAMHGAFVVQDFMGNTRTYIK